MAYDEALAERVREVIGVRAGVKEKRMFSSLAFILDGNMACAVSGDELIVRLGKEEAERALAETHVRQFEPAEGRRMSGFVVVSAEGVAEPDELAGWIDLGAEYAASLPPK